MHMAAREFEAASQTFFQAFKSYDEAGDPNRLKCLKRLAAASAPRASAASPPGSQEARPRRGDPRAQAAASLAQAFRGDAAQKKGLMTSHQFCQVRLQALCLEALKKGLEDDQALSLRRETLERRGVAKREAKAIPKDLRALLKAAVVRSGVAQRRLLLESQHLASDALPFQEPSPDGWSRRKSCLAAARGSLSPGDKRRASGELRKAASPLELRQLAKASFGFKQQVGDFFKSAASRPQALEERRALREEIFASFQNHANARSCKAVALLVEEARAPFGQRLAGAAGAKGGDDRGLGGPGARRWGEKLPRIMSALHEINFTPS